MYLTLHSYSQMWLVPWGHTRSKPSDYSDLINVARKAINAITKIHGTNYQLGPAAELMYPTSGKYFNVINFNFKFHFKLIYMKDFTY